MLHDFDKLPLTGWYPGHMLKAGREMRSRLDLVDVVVELLDARLPQTSRNPALEVICGEKPRLLVFNKRDLADPEATRRWEDYFRKAGIPALFVDGRTGAGVNRLLPLVKEVWEAERKRRGTTRPFLREIRMMVAGLPNVGKSTVVNRLAERHRAAVGPKPGVTRGVQWIQLQGGMEMLDTPGVFWPKLERKQDELLLGLAGCIKDDVIGEDLLVEYLFHRLVHAERGVNWELYGIAATPAGAAEFLDAVAGRRGFLLPGGRPDRQQAAVATLNDYRAGRLCRFTFDAPPD